VNEFKKNLTFFTNLVINNNNTIKKMKISTENSLFLNNKI